jgi:hypothetical protein
MLKEVDKYKVTAEKEAQRRLEVCRRMVKRMLDAHLAAAFNSLAQILSDRIQRRAVVNRVIRRLRHGLLTAKFEIWVEYVDACRAPLWALPLTLTLDMDFDSITDRESFFGDVVKDIAAAAKIDFRFVKVVGMRAGSVIVDLQIPPEAGDLDQIEEHLVGQVKHTDSALRRGKITAKAIKLERTSKMANHKQQEESDISMTKEQTKRTQRSANLFGQKSELKSSQRRTANEFEDPIPICAIDTKQGCDAFFCLTQQTLYIDLMSKSEDKRVCKTKSAPPPQQDQEDIKKPSHGLAYTSGGLTADPPQQDQVDIKKPSHGLANTSGGLTADPPQQDQEDIKKPSHGLAYFSGGLTVSILLLTAFRWSEGSGNMQSMSILLLFFVALFIFSLGSRGVEKEARGGEKEVHIKKTQKPLRAAAPGPGSTPKMVEGAWVARIYIVVIFAQCWMLWYTCTKHSARHLLPGIQ